MSKLRLSIGRALSVAFAVGICAVGLYVAAAPVWSVWKSTKASAADYEVGISDLQYTVKSTFRGTNITGSAKGGTSLGRLVWHSASFSAARATIGKLALHTA